MRGVRLGVLGLMSTLAVACDDGSASPSPPASATTTATADAAPAGLAGLKATLNGEPLALKTAVAYSRGGRGIELELSTATPDCEDFAGNGRMLADGERSFSVTIGPQLAKDGKESWAIGRLYFDGHTQQGGDLGRVKITSADAAEGVTGELAFELELKANEFMKKPARKLEVEGTFSARGCGTFDRKDGPSPRPQKKLTLTVAKTPFEIVAATIRPTAFPDPGHELLLSTAPASCTKSPSDADLTLKLNVADAGPAKKGRVQYAFMAGNLLSSQLNASPSKDGPTITATPAGPLEPEGDGAGEVTIALDGELDVLGYAVSVGGEVSALSCPADKK